MPWRFKLPGPLLLNTVSGETGNDGKAGAFDRCVSLDGDECCCITRLLSLLCPPDECLSQVSVASWNIRLFSNSSRTDEQIETIAGIVSQFDLVVIQELLDLAVLDRVLDQLTGLGKTYDVVVSPIV